MTEAEAKTKWCHESFATQAAGEPHPQFPGHLIGQRDGGFQMLCIGSACMAFRVADKVDRVPTDGGAFHRVIETKDAGCYCGLAGKP